MCVNYKRLGMKVPELQNLAILQRLVGPLYNGSSTGSSPPNTSCAVLYSVYLLHICLAGLIMCPHKQGSGLPGGSLYSSVQSPVSTNGHIACSWWFAHSALCYEVLRHSPYLVLEITP